MKHISIFLLTFYTLYVSGQNTSDVLRWSATDYLGSARTVGVGSAFGAMGGDFSVLNINPAGMADYRKSEFTFTPSLMFHNSEAYFTGDRNNSLLDNGLKMGLDNIGFVIAHDPRSTLTSSVFSIGFSRIADFRRNIQLGGVIPGSMTEYFMELANGNMPNELNDFTSGLAFDVGAIFPIDDRTYFTDFPEPDLPVNRTQNISEKGGINELALGYAFEVNNLLSFGISAAMPFGSFEQVKTYVEDDLQDEIPFFDRLEYIERLNTSGIGFNAKLGARVRLPIGFRVGASFHTPTWYRFTDDYDAYMEYSYIENNALINNGLSSPEGNFRYRINTPHRLLLSVGQTFSSDVVQGFINFDAENVGYNYARYDGTAFDNSISEQRYTDEVNRNIRNQFRSVWNYRIGGELAFSKVRLRGGIGIERNAFENETAVNNTASAGIGYRENNFFMDLGIRFSSYEEGYLPYTVTDISLDPNSVISTRRTRAQMTFGFKF
jgi:hypothetical protein